MNKLDEYKETIGFLSLYLPLNKRDELVLFENLKYDDNYLFDIILYKTELRNYDSYCDIWFDIYKNHKDSPFSEKAFDIKLRCNIYIVTIYELNAITERQFQTLKEALTFIYILIINKYMKAEEIY